MKSQSRGNNVTDKSVLAHTNGHDADVIYTLLCYQQACMLWPDALQLKHTMMTYNQASQLTQKNAH